MKEPRLDSESAPWRGEAVLLGLALAWIVAAAGITVIELETVGRLTHLVAGVDIIAGLLLPFALLWLAVSVVQPSDELPGGDDGNGGGRPPEDPDRDPPSGGLDIDWERFEADVYAYAQSREVVA